MDTLEFINRAYDHLTEKGYFIIYSKESYFSLVYAAADKNDPNYHTVIDSRFLISTKEEFSEPILGSHGLKYGITSITFSNLRENTDLFIALYNKAKSEDKKFFIKNIAELTRGSFKTDINKILDETCSTAQELIKMFKSFSISTLDTSVIDLPNLHKILVSKGINEKEKDDFYLHLFKSRKNQIASPSVGPTYKDFLISVYGYDEKKLSPYFSFFNFIKNEFVKPEIDFFENNYEIITSTRVNCEKAARALCIPNVHENTIKSEIESLVYRLKEYRSLTEVAVEMYDKKTTTIEVRCYSDKEDTITQTELNKLIKDFLLFKQSNPTITTTKEVVSSWLLKEQLSKELSDKQLVISSRMKI